MNFKVGDVVKSRFSVKDEATIIAIPEDDSAYVLLGWKQRVPRYGWDLSIGDGRLTGWGQLKIIHGMFRDFASAYWVVADSDIKLIRRDEKVKTRSYPHNRLYSPVSKKSLQKRARDQVAQQFLISKG